MTIHLFRTKRKILKTLGFYGLTTKGIHGPVGQDTQGFENQNKYILSTKVLILL